MKTGGEEFSRDTVEARLIEALRVFDRLAGGGKAWASDGPWHLSRLLPSEAFARDVEHLAMGEAIERLVRAPRPDRDMITRAEESTAWLVLIAERDRKLVQLVIRYLANGWSRVPWLKLREPLGITLGAGGLARRYDQAIEGLARTLRRQALGLAA